MIKQKRINVVKYRRVSTDEQKLKKNSLIAQDEILDEYIANHPEMVLVGEYSDEGVSGSRFNRTELQRLLTDIEEMDVDLILVTKLDRWFRDLPLYYKTQAILEKNNVAWKTVLEEYDTATADGRLKVNIMLSVAQNEIERTSERIKVVFDSKIKNKQAISGMQPFGFMTAEGNGARMVVHDPEVEQIVYDYLDHFEATHSKRGAQKFVNDKYGMRISYNVLSKLLKNPLLYGHYKGVDDYCEGYVTKERFDRFTKILSKNVKRNTVGRVYIFSGLLRCPVCNCRLSGYKQRYKNKRGDDNIYLKYYCSKHKIAQLCTHNKVISENVLERKVLKVVMPQLEKLVLETEVKAAKEKPKTDRRKIEAEMERLNKMYLKGRIKEEVYDREYEELSQTLNTIEKVEKPRDFKKIKDILEKDIPTLYPTFDAKEKQIFWRSIIDYITFDGTEPVIHFL